MDDERLALLHELEQADEAIAVELVEVDELLEAVESLRTGALELESFFASLPTERAAAAAAVDDAEHALAEAETAVQKAAAELASAEAGKNEERLADARRFELRARDSLHMAERAATASRERVAQLDDQAAAAERKTAVVENRRGRALGCARRSAAVDRRGRRRPGTGSRRRRGVGHPRASRAARCPEPARDRA